jgi:hypothetical protein
MESICLQVLSQTIFCKFHATRETFQYPKTKTEDTLTVGISDDGIARVCNIFYIFYFRFESCFITYKTETWRQWKLQSYLWNNPLLTIKLSGLIPRANYNDRETVASRRS